MFFRAVLIVLLYIACAVSFVVIALWIHALFRKKQGKSRNSSASSAHSADTQLDKPAD